MVAGRCLELDSVTRWAIEAAGDAIDGDATTTAWEAALRAPEWDGSSAWIHADLLRPNLLVERGRLCAVIDFGAAGVGDPATDVIAAWSALGQGGREVFRSALDVDDATWSRARGIALHQAVAIIPLLPDHQSRLRRSRRAHRGRGGGRLRRLM